MISFQMFYHLPKEIPQLGTADSPPHHHHLPSPGNQISVSMNLLILDISYKCNHTNMAICVWFLSLSIDVFNINFVAYLSIHSFFLFVCMFWGSFLLFVFVFGFFLFFFFFWWDWGLNFVLAKQVLYWLSGTSTSSLSWITFLMWIHHNLLIHLSVNGLFGYYG
jgi:hypothetical protein